MRKRSLVLLASLFLLTLAFSACGGTDDGGAAGTTPPTANQPAANQPAANQPAANQPAGDVEPINLSWWKLNEHVDGLNEVIASFTSQHPHVNITFAGHSNETLHQNLEISAMSGTLPSMWFQWGGALGGRYVQYGVTMNLNDFARDNNWDQRFTAAALELFTLHGQLSFYPRVMNVLMVYYRRDIFDNLGLTAPTTMAEFHHAVETIHAAGITPINTASIPGWHIMRFWEQLLEHYAGAAMHDQLQIFEVPWEGNQAVINSFATLQRYAQSGFFPDGFISMEPAELAMLIYPGFSAMQIEGPWFDRNLVRDSQDVANYGVFALPNGGTNRVSAFGEGFMFNANLTPAELEMAVKFLDYFFEPHNIEAFPTMYGTPIPMIGREGDIPPEHLNIPTMFEIASANGTFTINDQALPPIVVDTLFAVMDYVSLGSMTPEAAAAEMQRAVERHQAGE